MEPRQYELLDDLLDPHQIEQRNWSIKKSDLGGRGLFTTKLIKKGSLIFDNKPLVIGPRVDNVIGLYCTVCYKISDHIFKCDNNVCLMQLCSKECKIALEHKQMCDFITKNWIPKSNYKRSETLCRVQIYLKFLLLEDKNLLNILQKSETTLNFQEIDDLYYKYDVPDEQRNFMSVINSILKINSFRIASNPQDRKILLRGLYPLSSFLNHSCVPNTRNIFQKDYTMSVFATKDIKAGEEILTCYTGFLWSTPARRCQIYKTKKFWCKCRRCDDRTEMGTNLSALKCINKNCVGILLPVLPTDPRTDWNCDNCETRVPANRICVVQSALGSLVGTLDLDERFHLETVVLERLAKLIPYCSHIFVDLRLRLAIRVGSEGMKLNGKYIYSFTTIFTLHSQ